MTNPQPAGYDYIETEESAAEQARIEEPVTTPQTAWYDYIETEKSTAERTRIEEAVITPQPAGYDYMETEESTAEQDPHRGSSDHPSACRGDDYI